LKVIFFDGHCGLCNGFVDFIIKVDKKSTFLFSPLQSDYAKGHLHEEDIKELKSVVVLIDGKTFRKSKGVMAVFRELGGAWGGISVLRFLPSSFLDIGYDLIAENRYKIFGKRETCRLPTPDEKKRFIL
jgi:predicted DCC family thiol-disulfide oxidoreductase YuxK